jgi:hypothetical protein
MNICAQCGAETELYMNGMPICVKCAEDCEKAIMEALVNAKMLKLHPERPDDK